MVKVVEAPLKLRGKPAVTKKRVRNDAGETVTIRSIDSNSPTFAVDLTEVFRANVARARRENQRLSRNSK